MSERELFEQWISNEPYSKDIERFPVNGKSAWPGAYKDLSVHLAWDAWKERGNEAIAANQQVLVLAAANEKLTEQNHNLCLLVVRLARRVRFFEKGSDVATKALDYLSRNGLMPSVLREEKK